MPFVTIPSVALLSHICSSDSEPRVWWKSCGRFSLGRTKPASIDSESRHLGVDAIEECRRVDPYSPPPWPVGRLSETMQVRCKFHPLATCDQIRQMLATLKPKVPEANRMWSMCVGRPTRRRLSDTDEGEAIRATKTDAPLGKLARVKHEKRVVTQGSP